MHCSSITSPSCTLRTGTGSLASWALDNPDHPDRCEAITTADTHRAEWLRVYRDVFGFVTLVLRPTSD